MKKSILAASLIALAGNAFAGGYLTNTNQSVNFLRNPARDASIGIDGVYFNPAGAAFCNEGFHIQFNWQNAHQHRDAYANYNGLFKYNFGNPLQTMTADVNLPGGLTFLYNLRYSHYTTPVNGASSLVSDL